MQAVGYALDAPLHQLRRDRRPDGRLCTATAGAMWLEQMAPGSRSSELASPTHVSSLAGPERGVKCIAHCRHIGATEDAAARPHGSFKRVKASF